MAEPGTASAETASVASSLEPTTDPDAKGNSLQPTVSPAVEVPIADRTTLPPESAPATSPPFLPTLERLATEPEPTTTRPKIPGYEILERLGRGGMGVVYKARQLKLDRLVALKMILSGSYAGANELARFRTEAEALGRLRHPNIVPIFEVSEHNGRPFFVLEYVEGGSLEKKLQGVPQPPIAAAQLVETLARAMHAAHQRGIVHRDLKPANILLAPQATVHEKTQFGLPKITDFGLAKMLDDPEGQTATGEILGTRSYMAPEQAEGKVGEIGPAADVYALGAIFYELLTGRPPFRSATPQDVIFQVIADPPVPPSRLQPKVPLDAQNICLKCLEKKTQDRYPNALALAEDLARLVAGEPIQARPISSGRKVLRWVKRRREVALVFLGGLAALGFFLLFPILNRIGKQEAQGPLTPVNEFAGENQLESTPNRTPNKHVGLSEDSQERNNQTRAKVPAKFESDQRELEEKPIEKKVAEPGNVKASTALGRVLEKKAREIIYYFQDQGCKNIGVLKFLARKGKGPLTDNVGPLNRALANRLEIALVLANNGEEARQMGIIKHASDVAAKIRGGNHLDQKGRRPLFQAQYPLAWGQDQVKPDAFVTGQVEISSNLRKMTVTLEAIHEEGAVRELAPSFTVDVDPAVLVEMGESFSLLRSIGDNGQPVVATNPVLAADNVKNKKSDHPLYAKDRNHPTSPINLKIYYGGRQVPLEFRDGRAEIPEPEEGQEVVFVLEPTSLLQSRYGVVLLVNGQNTLYKEHELPAYEYTAHIFEPGDRPLSIRGYQINKDEIEKFRVLSPEESTNKDKAMNYSSDVGSITLAIFRELKDGANAERENDLAKSVRPIIRGVYATGEPKTLSALQSRLRASKLMCLIGEGEKAGSRVFTVPFERDPNPVMSATIWYCHR